jgi:uncharacterized protein
MFLGLVVGLTIFCVVLPATAIPGYTGYMVNDWAYLLSYEDDAYLENWCRDIEEETTVEIFIVTTTDLEGEDLDRYAYLLFNDWGIGKEDVDNGLLLILYYEDINETHFSWEFRVEVGLGLEGAITDSEAGRITRDEIVPWIELYDFGSAFWYGIEAFYNEFKDDPSVVSPSANPQGLAAFQAWGYENPWIAGLFIGVMLAMAFTWLQVSLTRGYQCIFPLVFIVATLLFAWWWDGSLAVLFYGIIFAVGGTVFIGGGRRVRSGGGRSVGGGYRQYG